MAPTSHGKMAEFYDNMTKEFVERCTICGECLEACPLFPLTKFADRGPQAVMEKMMQLLQGGEVSEEAYDMIVSCTWGCNICTKACPEGLIPRLAVMLATGKMASSGKELPRVFQQSLFGSRYSLANVLHALQVKPSEMRWIKKAPANPEPVDVVFWASCSGTCHPNVLFDIVDVLDRMGINFVALGGGEICCGLSAIMRGDLEAVESLGETFVSNIAAFHPKKALFLCQGCQARCSGALPGFTSLPFEYSWLPDFLVENLDRIPFTQRVDKVVTVHDSCGVTSLGTYEVTRELLRAIPGITLVEMEHNRENNLCCGGVAVHTRPEIAEHMRRAALQEADAAGADVLATTCIGCHLSFVPLEHQYRCEVQSFISLVAEAVGAHNEDRFKKYMSCGDPAEVLAEARDYINASDYSSEEMERVLPGIFNRLRVQSKA